MAGRRPPAIGSDDGPASGEAPPRFLRSMPRPLMALFLGGGAAALAVVLWLVVVPPGAEEAPLGIRRPPPAGGLSHGVGEIVLAPVPEALPSTPPACPALARVVVEGGDPAVGRIGEALEQLCTVAGPGVDPMLAEAVRALDGARIRFADFGRTGVEATVELAERRILLNVKFARTDTAPIHIAPVLAHEGWHLAAGAAPGALAEFRARLVELEACRQLIPIRLWARGCREAEGIVGLGPEKAVMMFVEAGYEAPEEEA